MSFESENNNNNQYNNNCNSDVASVNLLDRNNTNNFPSSAIHNLLEAIRSEANKNPLAALPFYKKAFSECPKIEEYLAGHSTINVEGREYSLFTGNEIQLGPLRELQRSPERLTDLTKLHSRVKTLLAQHSQTPANVTCAVLVTTGSFAPLHVGHVQMLKKAVTFVESTLKIDVLQAFFSPSHDTYVTSKFQTDNFPQKSSLYSLHRIRMIEGSVKDDPLLSVSGWEASRESHSTPTQVLDFLKNEVQQSLQKNFPQTQIALEMFYVCGSDQNALWIGEFEFPAKIVLVARPGYKIENLVNGSVFVIEDPCTEISSSFVRRKLSENPQHLAQPTAPIVPPFVAQYLSCHKPDG